MRVLQWHSLGINSAASAANTIGTLATQTKQQVIELPIKHPELFEALGVAQPKGMYTKYTSYLSSCVALQLSAERHVELL
jgi:hypothetical protein